MDNLVRDEWVVLGTGPSIEDFDFEFCQDKTTIGCSAIGKLYQPDYYWLNDPVSTKKFGHMVNGSEWVTEHFTLRDGKDPTDREYPEDLCDFHYKKYVDKEPDIVVTFDRTFRREEFSDEKFRNANSSGFACLSFIIHYFNPKKIYLAGFDGYDFGNEHFYPDPHHGPDSDNDYWDEEYVRNKNRRCRMFMLSFLEYCERNRIYVEFLTPTKYI